jgi:hypothetical protein
MTNSQMNGHRPTARSLNQLKSALLQPRFGDPRTYKYHPSLTLALGKGFNPADVLDSKPHFLKFTPVQIDAGTGVKNVEAYYVSSFEEFSTALSWDSKASASALGSKASFSTKFGLNAGYSDTSVIIVLHASADFGRFGIGQDYQLRDDAAQVLKDTPSDFLFRYGNRYVESERRGAAISIVLTLDNVSSSFKSSLKSSASAGGKFGPIKGSASTELAIEVSAAFKHGRASGSVFAAGAQTAMLEQVLKGLGAGSSDPFAALTGALASTLAALDTNSGIPIQYYVADMKTMGVDDQLIDLWDDYRENLLRGFAEEYGEAVLEATLLREFAEPDSVYGRLVRYAFGGGGVAFIDKMIAGLSSLETYIAAVAKAHSDLKKSVARTTVDVPVRPNIIPSSLMKKLMVSPTISYFAPDFDDVEIARILAAPPGQRLAAAQFIKSDIKGIGITAGLDGIGLVSRAAKSIYSDGTVQLSGTTGASEGGAWIYCIEPNSAGYSTEEQNLLDWAAKHVGEYSIDECSVVEDFVGRQFTIPRLRISFQADGTKLNWFKLKILNF